MSGLWNGLAALAVIGLAGIGGDDFKREGDAERRAKLDPLEGKAPPALSASDWMNAEDGGLRLSDLKGEVVLLDFWGTW